MVEIKLPNPILFVYATTQIYVNIRRNNQFNACRCIGIRILSEKKVYWYPSSRVIRKNKRDHDVFEKFILPAGKRKPKAWMWLPHIARPYDI